MKKFELVCVIDAGLTSGDITSLKERIVKHVTSRGGTILDTDDIGLLPMAYPANGQDQASLVSYHISFDAQQLIEAKSEMRLEKGLLKFFFYGMKDDAKFLRYADLQAQFVKIKEEEEEAQEEAEETEAQEA